MGPTDPIPLPFQISFLALTLFCQNSWPPPNAPFPKQLLNPGPNCYQNASVSNNRKRRYNFFEENACFVSSASLKKNQQTGKVCIWVLGFEILNHFSCILPTFLRSVEFGFFPGPLIPQSLNPERLLGFEWRSLRTQKLPESRAVEELRAPPSLSQTTVIRPVAGQSFHGIQAALVHRCPTASEPCIPVALRIENRPPPLHNWQETKRDGRHPIVLHPVSPTIFPTATF